MEALAKSQEALDLSNMPKKKVSKLPSSHCKIKNFMAPGLKLKYPNVPNPDVKHLVIMLDMHIADHIQDPIEEDVPDLLIHILVQAVVTDIMGYEKLYNL